MKGILFYQTVICVVNIAFGLFSLDQSLDDPSLDIFASIVALFNLLTSTFVCCYYAEGVTTDLLRVGDIFYNSFWYKLSSQEQKILILLIQRSQIIFRLKGFEFFDCSLEVFAVVCSWMLIPKLVEIYFKMYFWFADDSKCCIVFSYNEKTEVNWFSRSYNILPLDYFCTALVISKLLNFGSHMVIPI